MTSGVAIVDVTLEATATVPMNSVLIQSAGDGDSRRSIRALQEAQKQESGVQHAARPHKAQSPPSLTKSDFRLSRSPGGLQLENEPCFKDTEALAFEVLDRCQNHWCSNKNCIYSCGGRLTLLLEAEDAYRPVFSLSRFATSVL